MNSMKDNDTPSNDFFRLLVEHVNDWIWQINEQWEFTYSNSIVEETLGYSANELLGKSMFSFIKINEVESVQAIVLSAMENNSSLQNLDFTMIHRNGHEVFIETNANPIIDNQNNTIGYRGINRDITLWKKNQDRQQQLLDIIEASPDLIATADSFGNTTYLNPSARAFLGIPEGIEELHSVNAQLWTNKIVDINENELSAEKSIWRGENTLSNSMGKEIPVSQIIVTHKANNQNIHFLSTIARDISERKAYEKIIKRQALYDTLTELPNRRHLYKTISRLMDSKDKEKTFALLFIDIDDFKQINDTLGHKYGDRALKLIAARMKGSVRENDFLCRLGGDEFILLVEGMNTKQEVEDYAKRLISIFNHPLRMDNKLHSITCSIGISIYPDHGKDIETLMQNADKIMYHMKKQGKNGFQITQTNGG
ncbi:diguanylate cyclase domain-containing protein [Niallia sp. Sow4_A1]|uniref:Diguanylate cyclase n=1 Tax=Niallia hominis TaxID=3133173 RepID=A0ABV1F059_9BACI|nr:MULTISPECIES: diguanylate cyclase [Bacillaceae]MCM3362195.1 diguanylate cyclase [Niallia sp. MER TA 168]